MAHGASLSANHPAVADCVGNQGCGQSTNAGNNYGSGFNAAGGGIYAMEWTSERISVWFFPRDDARVSAALAGANGTAPDPESFGTPQASFSGSGGCNIDEHFMNHSIIFDTTFCGDWAGNVWEQDQACSALAPSCEQYVGENPEEFADAYWLGELHQGVSRRRSQRTRPAAPWARTAVRRLRHIVTSRSTAVADPQHLRCSLRVVQ